MMIKDLTMRILLAVSALAFSAACASSTIETDPVVVDAPPVADAAMPSAYDLAMGTVDDLLAAGNEQTAILRLEQLVGMQTASDAEKASALFRIAELKLGE